ncbi:hypothetical protein SH661x_001252 [Planctomicrobium sp. SH661]|uniref:hypothetical protein n=1 Tax=Planctomicrobium sp. SH661 TaxID=3448124 RepID=UPI003F5B3C9E
MDGPLSTDQPRFPPDVDRSAESLDQAGSSQLPDDGLKNLAQAARTDHLRSARITMFAIGGITIAVNLLLALFAKSAVDSQFEAEIRQLQNQGMVLDMEQVVLLKADAVRSTQLSGFGFAGMGVIFLVLGALVYKYPVPCTVLALILYLAGLAMTGLSDPTLLARGIFIKIIIIVALAKAIQTATAYGREQLATGS